ncbi:hypothetical protein AVEN_55212-1 [Araneus ventricosus]|uniref:Uncharacterized protein n=1 Tax=Araneus ventricosus TaxID=182803 RepID=A0A4Y2GAM0_ARAVE|nr:hypothetical protein AVEN_55212-1 [Araneus ventricosus]
MNRSILSDRTSKCMKRCPLPNLAISKRRDIIPTEQYPAVFEELSKKIVTEDESDVLYLDGEVTEYSDLKTDSETDLENNPVLEHKLKLEHKYLYHP